MNSEIALTSQDDKAEMDANLKRWLRVALTQFLGRFPESDRERVKNSVYIAGGSIVNYLLSEDVKDFDFFVKTEEQCNWIRDYFANHPDKKSIGLRARTMNAITLEFSDLYREPAIQVITRFFGPPERVFTTFDYEHCKCYYDFQTDELHYNEEVILKKQLRYTGEKDKYSLNTLKRLVKYTNRGWKVDNESLVNLHKSCAKNDLNDPEVMKELAGGFYGSSME